MQERELAALAATESDSIIYMIDQDTYDLIYLNRQAKSIFGIDDLSAASHTKCYEVIHHLDTPCATCQKHLADKLQFYHWRHYNDHLQNYFDIRCKLLDIEEHTCCLCISDYATHRVQQIQTVKEQLDTAHALVECIRTLDGSKTVEEEINRLLEIMATFFAGERCYLFEIDYNAQTTSNTYEWVADGVTAEIDLLQNIPLEVIDTWLHVFREQGTFYISDTDTDLEQDSDTYKILKQQNIHKLIAVPLIEKGTIIGFLGIDNPQKNYHDTTLLSSVTYFLLSYLGKRKISEYLEKLSFEDSMTGLFNRNYYNMLVQGLSKHPPLCLGIVYLDLNELKYINDHLGHTQGDALIRKTATNISTIFGKDVMRIGGDEFIVILPDIAEDLFAQQLAAMRNLMYEDGIRVSIGTSWRNGNAVIAEQIAEAEYAMYRDKDAFYKEKLKQKK